MPTESMVFPQTVLPMPKQRGRDDMKYSTRETLDLNLQLGVEVQLVWQNIDNGKFRVLIVNRSVQWCQLESGATIIVSDPWPRPRVGSGTIL
jgi:hypothetical protein